MGDVSLASCGNYLNAQFNEARSPVLSLKRSLVPYIVCANSRRSGETVWRIHCLPHCYMHHCTFADSEVYNSKFAHNSKPTGRVRCIVTAIFHDRRCGERQIKVISLMKKLCYKTDSYANLQSGLNLINLI